MKREHQDTCAGSSYGGGRSGNSYSSTKSECSSMSTGKAMMWEDEQDHDGGHGGGMDELLAALGYKVRSSDMADVAQKLEQLEMAMGITQEDVISHLSSDTVHYDPTDLYSWVQTMLTEINPDNKNNIINNSNNNNLNYINSRIVDDSEYDLRAIPGIAAYPIKSEPSENNTTKRLKSSPLESDSSSLPPVTVPAPVSPTRSVVLVDSQETGVRLVHALMACAEAVQQENLKLADALLKHVHLLAASQAGAMRKVASYFAQALYHRIYRSYPQETLVDSSFSDMLHMHFYESCPYLKFAHFTANQAILEAFSSAAEVHVIDFGLKQGMQWPALMQALARRPGGAPSFRLTGIGPPQNDNVDSLQQVGVKLAQLAQTFGVRFVFRGFVCNSLADLDQTMLDIRAEEAVAVNSVFELHRMFARPGSIEKILATVKMIKPKIVTIVEQEANHNGPVFMDRFNEALHYYSSLFDSLEGTPGSLPSSQDALMSELYLGRQICNVVASEGVDRVERHETLNQWRVRMGSTGFEPVHLGSNAFKQASMLLALFAGGDGYRVEENKGCLMLGWHTRPLIATSAWKVHGTES
ncbi:unnamed protein product [Lupinus luteus]|uniref:DELLA protein n=1 Tax=Lupinus luteus TaxID=3873 RepID=A0AAV1VWX0_LUPLU